MSQVAFGKTIQHMLRVMSSDLPGVTDGDLLTRYLDAQDMKAYEALVRRHGPMVWGVCRRLLQSPQDAEDAFQATFLVLVRKARSVVPRSMVGNWLHGVARQTAVRIRAMAAKRSGRERQVTEIPDPAVAQKDIWSDLQPVLDHELSRLPGKYRAVVVLCYLEGKTRKEVAQELGWPEGTVAGNLARAREILAKRLSRQGLTVTGSVVGLVLTTHAASACPPSSVLAPTIQAATTLAASGAIPAKIAVLTDGVIRSMFMTKAKFVTVAILFLAGMGVLTSTGIGLFDNRTAADEKPVIRANQPEGKKAEVGFARLGQKRDDIIAKYGKPTKTVNLASGIDSLEFQKGPIRILVEISPKNDRAIQLYFFKKTPFTGIQIAELLERNAEGQKWWTTEVSPDGFVYHRTDGGIARGGKRGEESMFAVLSGSEVQGRNPQTDADRDKAAKEELREIEGF